MRTIPDPLRSVVSSVLPSGVIAIAPLLGLAAGIVKAMLE